ncbi:KpsF/GutQ family sugar-phosphate isomerase [Novispirillum itersonii]|uniref:Arabinose-5-phosphate isomerase n=1 Tax=Novispirillum itersonii TaxID=189 RepID=A0A7W9ZCR6_NOVIT|nr:KpsF/GutQ family sugar-phosphate isomerase [Novispirillum itersonii]MBB6209062.1 arabinose-5-phosphate isomerase [Novispirillum itersonii]
MTSPDVSAQTPADRDLASARRTLSVEIDGLVALRDGLNGEFARAVAILAAISGRVIVSGMGKSGHIGCKIAATLASTGTPSFFVHPAEASHGDLGMITRDDAVIALSNSGETPELADIIAYCRRFSIPLIAITSRGGSTLAQSADCALILPGFTEACPNGLAPTTSTTLTLALGDALAVALLERIGFSAQDFKVFHPGGKLGKKLQRVADLMHGPDSLPLCQPDTPMSEALMVMTGKSFGCTGVVDEAGLLVGVITDGDLRRHMNDNLVRSRAADIMTRAPKHVPPMMVAAEALRLMNDGKVTGLFVVDEGRPVGFLHVHDLLRAGVA